MTDTDATKTGVRAETWKSMRMVDWQFATNQSTSERDAHNIAFGWETMLNLRRAGRDSVPTPITLIHHIEHWARYAKKARTD